MSACYVWHKYEKGNQNIKLFFYVFHVSHSSVEEFTGKISD